MKNRYPTVEELWVIEHEARRLRAETMARLFRHAGEAVRNYFRSNRAKGLRHA